MRGVIGRGRRQDMLDRRREMAKTMTSIEVAKIEGVSVEVIQRYACYHGYTHVKSKTVPKRQWDLDLMLRRRREMAETMTVREIAEREGVSEGCIRDYLVRHKITAQRESKDNLDDLPTDPREIAEMLLSIRMQRTAVESNRRMRARLELQ